LVVDVTGVAGLEVDSESGLVTAAAGVSVDALLRVLVPRGRFVPVTPGTRHVTVGGAIAADIHGKNHHRVGSWCDAVVSLRLLLPSGDVVEVSRDADPELFWATAGGMGLTGVIVDATFACPAIESSQVLVETRRFGDLDGVMAAMVAGDASHDFSVAWIDLVAGGRQLGRSVLTRGRFARVGELPVAAQADPLAYDPKVRVVAPPWVPGGLLNRWTVRAFNEVWFRKAPRLHVGLESIPQFFHPLDFVDGWNRIYGGRGFLQWQVVVPDGSVGEAALRRVVERLSGSGCGSFLAVLKRFGPGNDGMLSFPMAGWTLALDIPAGVAGLGGLLDELDRLVVDSGGRVYLAKDSRMDPGLVAAMYPRLEEWRVVRDRVDPHRVLQSDLSRRLGL
jgi:decaprenylphospho-beta-D-ribofuranose 2-oxidase